MLKFCSRNKQFIPFLTSFKESKQRKRFQTQFTVLIFKILHQIMLIIKHGLKKSALYGFRCICSVRIIVHWFGEAEMNVIHKYFCHPR